MTRGFFIVFEGGDGAGKTTHAAALADHLERVGWRVRRTFEPGDTAMGASVRQIVLTTTTPLAPRTEALLYAADKAQHVAEVVRPALEAGEIVVCDRYVDSTIAYQGAGRALDPDDIARLGWWAVGGLKPDLTVLLDVSVADGLDGKDTLDRMEAAGTDFHERVRGHFLALAAADPARYLVVAGRGPMAETTAAIRAAVEARLAGPVHR